MQIYQVGGSVRDQLMGLPSTDRDWVVVGALPDQMEALGYRQVGKDFPVFLHPVSREEYALARTERKVGPGYRGFTVYAAPDVTLADDLRRRDLTINAMALDQAGHLIDPHNGAEDLKCRILRHVSPAFAEDPVRILRVARFAARFAPLGFQVADETVTLMKLMVEQGEVDALVPERVWTELERALGEARPSYFFEVLRSCGALRRLFPELDQLFGVPQTRLYHPEIDTGIHVLQVLNRAAQLSPDPQVRYAALLHDLGKGLTPPEIWPSHRGHEQRGLSLIHALCQRLRTPRDYRELAILVAKYHGVCHRAFELRPATVLKLLESVDAFRRPARFESFLLACTADYTGRPAHEQYPYHQARLLLALLQSARNVNAARLAVQGLHGDAFAKALRRQRIAAIRTARSQANVSEDDTPRAEIPFPQP
jgi:tRNA nucleotidyltransferase (CCA-adding enzyme)